MMQTQDHCSMQLANCQTVNTFYSSIFFIFLYLGIECWPTQSFELLFNMKILNIHNFEDPRWILSSAQNWILSTLRPLSFVQLTLKPSRWILKYQNFNFSKFLSSWIFARIGVNLVPGQINIQLPLLVCLRRRWRNYSALLRLFNMDRNLKK